MNRKAIEQELEKSGFSGFSLWKTDGIYYLLDGNGVVNEHLERCLHCTVINGNLLNAAITKAQELTNV